MRQTITLLALQTFVGIISLAGTLIVVSVVIFLILTSNKSGSTRLCSNKFYRIRDRYFWGTCLLLILLLFVSLSLLPYRSFRAEAEEVVTVVGVQWDWQMSVGTPDSTHGKFPGKNEISLPVNKNIKFIVTSNDVTHNFGIYTNTGTLLTQIQAMPEYSNELHYVFTQKGNYTVLCLEYCGLAHAFMTAKIHVY